MEYYAGVDLGGTNIAVGIVNSQKQIVGRTTVKTNPQRHYSQVLDDLCTAVHTAAADASITTGQLKWIGIGSPGTVDNRRGMVEHAYNLNFTNVPVGQLVSERMRLPIFLENDANAAAYGEALAGAAKEKENVLMMTVGTGVGGGIIIRGEIYAGFCHAGAEIGHALLCYHGEPCTCGRHGCIEAYCSATALIRQTRRAMKAHPSSVLWQICEGSLDKVDGKSAFLALRQGDSTGQKVIEQYIDYLGEAIASLINIFQPEVFVLGGGISAEGDLLFQPLRQVVDREVFVKNPMKKTELLPAMLGNDAGIIGAAFLGKSVGNKSYT